MTQMMSTLLALILFVETPRLIVNRQAAMIQALKTTMLYLLHLSHHHLLLALTPPLPIKHYRSMVVARRMTPLKRKGEAVRMTVSARQILP